MAFNVFDFATGQLSYPERVSHVYFNGRVGARLEELKDIKTPSAKEKKEIKELEAELEKSKLSFHLRGVSAKVRDILEREIDKRAEKEGWSASERNVKLAHEIYAKTIVKVVNPDGEVNDDPWTGEDVERLIGEAPNGALTKFVKDCAHVAVKAIQFDDGVDVPF